MSVAECVKFTLGCADCDYEATAPADVKTIADAAADFTSDGWTERGGFAVCPACSEEG